MSVPAPVDLCQLIRCVRNQNCLWDMRDKNYHSRDNARLVWQAIADELKTDIDTVKFKWRSLRDTFRKEHKRCGGKSIWPYYFDMTFLMEQLSLRKARREENQSQNSTSFSEDRPELITLPQLETPTLPEKRSAAAAELNPPTAVVATKKFKSGKMNTIEKLVEIEQMKLEEFKKKSRNELDSDHQFLISLLPYMRRVPIDRKMFVRAKLQQVFCDEQMLKLQRPYVEPASVVLPPPTLTPIVGKSVEQHKTNSNDWSDDAFSDDDDEEEDDSVANQNNGECENPIPVEQGLGFEEEVVVEQEEEEADVKPIGATLFFATHEQKKEIYSEETLIQGVTPPSASDKQLLRLTEKHFPTLVPATPKKQSPTRHCYICNNTTYGAKKRRESRYMCSKCGVALCVQPCFEIYHTKEFF